MEVQHTPVSHRPPNIARKIRQNTLRVLLSSTLALSMSCDEKNDGDLKNVADGEVRTVVSRDKTAPIEPGNQKVLGTGWYASVEIDDDDRVHLAWVDADKGDVIYTSVPPGKDTWDPPVIVEEKGAAGSYLSLTLAPGGVPVLVYYHQDERTLRVAHRPQDLAKLKERGVVVDESPPTDDQKAEQRARMGAGWWGEDITFGEQVGVGSAATVDDRGIIHVVYYARGIRFRYATRPAGKAAFGAGVSGQFELLDVDQEAGSSYTMRTDVAVFDNGDVVTSFCHWTFGDAALKIGVRKQGAATFEVVTFPSTKATDGWQTTLHKGNGTTASVFSVAVADQKLSELVVDSAKVDPATKKTLRLERVSAAVVRKAKDDGTVILARGIGLASIDDTSGIWLTTIAPGAARPTSRTLLESGAATDPWIDLALRADGTPVAVWTTADHLGMRIYGLKSAAPRPE